jgi:two-component system, chemotaxis family, protein-glutamate methylesterase/glutaminase
MSTADVSTRVLVCDESPEYANSLAQFLGANGELEVVGVCATGEEAVGALDRLSPDLVTIGLELPGMGGIRAIEAIMHACPVPIVVVSDGAGRGSEKTAAALAAGAMEALPKALLRFEDPQGPAAVALRHRLKRLARNGVNGGHAPHSSPRPSSSAHPHAAATVVGICASAGGPPALEVILAGLPADFPLPVLVVQHITVGFIDGLVRQLDQRVPLPVRIASDGQAARPGIWFPPDDTHLLLEPGMRLRLDGETVVSAHRPSGDVLLESMAAAAGAGAVGVVVTGMGRDGARGVAAIRGNGGSVIAQDERSSAVFGMPRAAAEAGAEIVLPLPAIAGALNRLARVETQA